MTIYILYPTEFDVVTVGRPQFWCDDIKSSAVLLQSLKVDSSVKAGSWLPVFFTNYVKHAGNKKFSFAYILARKYQNFMRIDKVIKEVKGAVSVASQCGNIGRTGWSFACNNPDSPLISALVVVCLSSLHVRVIGVLCFLAVCSQCFWFDSYCFRCTF